MKKKTTTSKIDTRKYSSLIVDGADRAPNRSMLRAVGFKDKDFTRSVVGVASTWSMVTPCNMHINLLADHAGRGVNGAGGKSVIFNTITVSDGISMGTPGMRYSLVSREVIADSIETVAGAEGFDGIVENRDLQFSFRYFGDRLGKQAVRVVSGRVLKIDRPVGGLFGGEV